MCSTVPKPSANTTPCSPVSESPSLSSAATLSSQSEDTPIGKDNLLSVFTTLLTPASLVISLWGVCYYYEGELRPTYLLLSVLVFALTFPGKSRLQRPLPSVALNILLNWAWVVGLLLVTGFATGYRDEFYGKALVAWFWIAPMTEFGASVLLRSAAPSLLRLQGPPQRAIIVGMNSQGVKLATMLTKTPYCRVKLCGFVDSRSTDRSGSSFTNTMLGKLSDIASVVKEHDVQVIYLSLPMTSQPRILQVLDELKDTTASIYFVPDMFVTDLIQGHANAVCGVPVIGVCESPFVGFRGVIKRISDIVFSILILILITPILVAVAIAVKLTSPGPIIFKQRRYGLDGKEILVYKFRSMSVTEDGGTITQAQKNDARITPIGAVLRKTSLDELPQFINVLQGRMSIVGPRPHAVAHNEIYRKLIKGYMVRHKVKPGITGWAQVNGLRGETDTLDKMQGRIDYDLEYLRNWSLRLDVHIILRTIRLVAKDQKAY